MELIFHFSHIGQSIFANQNSFHQQTQQFNNGKDFADQSGVHTFPKKYRRKYLPS
jgi:hypothetical protein